MYVRGNHRGWRVAHLGGGGFESWGKNQWSSCLMRHILLLPLLLLIKSYMHTENIYIYIHNKPIFSVMKQKWISIFFLFTCTTISFFLFPNIKPSLKSPSFRSPSPCSTSACIVRHERPPWIKGEMLFTVRVMALTWTVSKQKLLSLYRPPPLFFYLPLIQPRPSTCILHVNTNKMECIANSQMGSNPTTVKRLRLIWFSPRFHWEARPEPGSWHSMNESGWDHRTRAETMEHFSLGS